MLRKRRLPILCVAICALSLLTYSFCVRMSDMAFLNSPHVKVLAWQHPKWIPDEARSSVGNFFSSPLHIYYEGNDSISPKVAIRHIHEIAAFDSVREINIDGGTIDPQSLIEVSHMPRLGSLALLGDNFSDAHLHSVVGCGNLRGLTVDSSQISDRGAYAISSLKGLQDLRLFNTRITKNGIKKIRISHPNCLIIVDGFVVQQNKNP